MQPLIEEFKDFYREMGQIKARQFSELYHDQILFRDPIHEIRGADHLYAYLVKLCANLEFCRFEYLDQVVQPESAYIKWNMNFRHPRLGDCVHTVRGMSHIQFDQRIYYHEDVYDLGAMLYEHVPVLGAMTRWVKGRLSTE